MSYPKVKTLSELLTWSHYVELLKIDDPLERSFYEKECSEEHWGRSRTETSDEKYAFSSLGA